jgi:hypothetical protein
MQYGSMFQVDTACMYTAYQLMVKAWGVERCPPTVGGEMSNYRRCMVGPIPPAPLIMIVQRISAYFLWRFSRRISP